MCVVIKLILVLACSSDALLLRAELAFIPHLCLEKAVNEEQMLCNKDVIIEDLTVYNQFRPLRAQNKT